MFLYFNNRIFINYIIKLIKKYCLINEKVKLLIIFNEI
jgi:hypothetical protein